jgi:hypothetical protein
MFDIFCPTPLALSWPLKHAQVKQVWLGGRARCHCHSPAGAWTTGAGAGAGAGGGGGGGCGAGAGATAGAGAGACPGTTCFGISRVEASPSQTADSLTEFIAARWRCVLGWVGGWMVEWIGEWMGGYAL